MTDHPKYARTTQLAAPGDMTWAFFAGVLGTAGLTMGIVSAVMDSSVLAIIAGCIALVLAVVAGWLLQSRRKLAAELQLAQSQLARPVSEPTPVVDHSPTTDAAVEDPRDTSTRVKEAADSAGYARVSEALAGESTTELTDARTGLLGEQYFKVTLDGRVASARRHLRPLALILLDVIEGASHESPKHADPVKVAEIAQQTLRDADTLCRLDDGRFAMVLEDTPENGAIWTVERIRRRINEELEDTTAWAGVACYPAHGFDGAEVLAQARKAITAARDWRQDRTEVADS